MRVLGIDTATDDTVVGVINGDRSEFERRVGPDGSGRPRHSETLLRSVADGVVAAGGWGGVERLAVGVGPGTFTGIRIGIATARGLVLATDVPVVAVPTLAALARGAARQASEEGPVMAVLDARRGEVFAALHDPDGRELEPPLVCSPERLIRCLEAISTRLPRAPLIAGPGSVRFRERLEQAGFQVPAPDSPIHRLSGRSLCELGSRLSPSEDNKSLEPIYLRAPDAQVWLERDRRSGTPG
ncbi:MAG: tRNA (adenosine(37)-N6)-threonylcarbamoyltransferase complex dimerization subunit type 1 TsaB [Solirubrobacterales bacterium]|nr:tRNA (adenosine(37)-N6)-threonylcarbamoyltransferase complex dimerization subunit type 1 TsaB [Solirubrobacterales bacterium]